MAPPSPDTPTATASGTAPPWVPGTGNRPPARWIAEEAQLLLDERRRGFPVPPLTARRRDVTLVHAYQVQASGIALRVAAGARLAGHKIGLAAQAQRGVSEPVSGILLDDMLVRDGGELDAGAFLAPRVEAGIAFRLGTDLRGRNVDAAAARAAVAQVLLALEVVDTRFEDWRFELVDSVADNASCARAVTATAVPPTGIDLAAEEVVLDVDGVAVATGAGSTVLGDPYQSLAWLARRLGEFRGGLRAGDLVLAGPAHPSVPLRPGTEVRTRSPHLPSVQVSVR